MYLMCISDFLRKVSFFYGANLIIKNNPSHALPYTLTTGAVSFVSPFDVAYYEGHCQHYFSIDCPNYHSLPWLCSKIITNCTSPDYPYHCILNTAGKVVNVCAAAQICQKGTVPIFDPSTRTISCQNCQKGYYQPLQLWSNNTSYCRRKSRCDINIHQIECTVEPEKELTQDTLCRCDARNGYILSVSEIGEICVPVKYANCYPSKCPDGQERLLNDRCVQRCEEGFQRNDSDICVPKSAAITTTGGSISAEIVIIVSVVIFVYIIVLIIIVRWKRRNQIRQTNKDTNEHDAPREKPNQDNNEYSASMEWPNQGTTKEVTEHGCIHKDTSGNAVSSYWSNQEILHRTVLNRCLQVLIRDLDFSTVMIHIQQKEIFDFVTRRDIMEQKTTTDKIKLLIEKLMQKSQYKYEEFKECLVLSKQEYLKEMLEEVEKEITHFFRDTHQSQDTVNPALDINISSTRNSLDDV